MERDVLLQELLYLKCAREFEQRRADLIAERKGLVDDLRRQRFNIFLKGYINRRISKIDYDVWDCNCRIKEFLNSCDNAQNKLPRSLTLDLHYVRCAIDDLLTGRTGTLEGVKTLFELRYHALKDEVARRSVPGCGLDLNGLE